MLWLSLPSHGPVIPPSAWLFALKPMQKDVHNSLICICQTLGKNNIPFTKRRGKLNVRFYKVQDRNTSPLNTSESCLNGSSEGKKPKLRVCVQGAPLIQLTKANLPQTPNQRVALGDIIDYYLRRECGVLATSDFVWRGFHVGIPSWKMVSCARHTAQNTVTYALSGVWDGSYATSEPVYTPKTDSPM